MKNKSITLRILESQWIVANNKVDVFTANEDFMGIGTFENKVLAQYIVDMHNKMLKTNQCANTQKVIRISKENDELVIRATAKDLAFVAENHPEYPYKVNDIEAFLNAVINEFISYSTQNEVEKGSTHIEECFDDILCHVSEGGHDFIEIIESK